MYTRIIGMNPNRQGDAKVVVKDVVFDTPPESWGRRDTGRIQGTVSVCEGCARVKWRGATMEGA